MKKVSFKYAQTYARGPSDPIDGYEFDLGGVRMVTHRTEDKKGWLLSEYSTGCAIGLFEAKTRKSIQERAECHFMVDRPDHFQILIRQINSNPTINL